MVGTPFLFHNKLTEAVVTHSRYLLWCCAVLNAFLTGIASGFEINDKDLNCVNLIHIINFIFFYFMLVRIISNVTCCTVIREGVCGPVWKKIDITLSVGSVQNYSVYGC